MQQPARPQEIHVRKRRKEKQPLDAAGEADEIQQELFLLVRRAQLVEFLEKGWTEPDDGICAIGSGGPYALAAARALSKFTKLGAKDIAQEAMRIASEICIFTNANFSIEEL